LLIGVFLFRINVVGLEEFGNKVKIVEQNGSFDGKFPVLAGLLYVNSRI
jgi:hypothetical protein